MGLKVDKTELPVWMVKRLQDLYPDMSIQAAIKHYIKYCLDNGVKPTTEQ